MQRPRKNPSKSAGQASEAGATHDEKIRALVVFNMAQLEGYKQTIRGMIADKKKYGREFVPCTAAFAQTMYQIIKQAQAATILMGRKNK